MIGYRGDCRTAPGRFHLHTLRVRHSMTPRSYLGAAPGQTEARLWWSFATTGTSQERIKADQGFFRYDLHDYRCIAFFFHLTPVDEFSGPHVYVKSSHGRSRFGCCSARRDNAPMRRLPGGMEPRTSCRCVAPRVSDSPRILLVITKAPPPLRGDRLMLRVRYTINDDGSRSDRSPRTD